MSHESCDGSLLLIRALSLRTVRPVAKNSKQELNVTSADSSSIKYNMKEKYFQLNEKENAESYLNGWYPEYETMKISASHLGRAQIIYVTVECTFVIIRDESA